jgi:prepilin-type N-terminal cleavage/methylation domain-containing protein
MRTPRVALLLLPLVGVKPKRRWRRSTLGQAGFTLAEILIACAVIGLGLVGVSSGLNMGVQAAETGRQQSTAVYLAEQRMDQVKAAALRASDPPFTYVTSAAFPSEAYGSITYASGFRRTVTLTPYTGPAAGLPTGVPGLRVDVTVFYRPVTAVGVLTTERSVVVSTFLVGR